MEYTIKVNEVQDTGSNVRGFATVVIEESFKITNIAILENKEKGQLFVSMPRYKSNERTENNKVVYKDICNPITKEFHDRLYGDILEVFHGLALQERGQELTEKAEKSIQKFSVSVTPYEKEGSSIRGLARIYFEDCFLVNNVTILQGKENIFVVMPSYKTNQVDEQGKTVYQDVCYPVTKEFRERLFGEIMKTYEEEKNKLFSDKSAKQKKEQDGNRMVHNQSDGKRPHR